MPTYDYECSACGHRTEIFQKITDEPVTKCPSCNKKKFVRQFGTGAAIVFKGSGFYQTDYRSESYKKGESSESKPSDSKADSSPTTSKDATPKSEPTPKPKKETGGGKGGAGPSDS